MATFPSYTWIDLNFKESHEEIEESTPSHQFQIRSYIDITPELEFNSAVYYYDDVTYNEIPGFTRVDAGLTWHPSKNIDVSVWGQNLSKDNMQNMGPTLILPEGLVKFKGECMEA